MYERVIEAIAGRMIAAEEPGVRARDLRVAAGILNYIRMRRRRCRRTSTA